MHNTPIASHPAVHKPGDTDVNQDQACYYMITGILAIVALVLFLI